MNGIIIIDKPKGRTSHDMVSFMRRMTGIRRVGHTGTLDPMATGVLPICIGSATKISDMLTMSDKGYRAELILGKTTDTQDADGKVLTECSVDGISEDDIRNAINGFIGEIEQIPPMYSAIKHNGKKLYELARQGIEIERKRRRVNIYSIDILNVDMNSFKVTIEVVCSKGTYIRTLCHDIGQSLGVGAYMNILRRTKTGCFTLEDAYTVDEIEKMRDDGTLESKLMSPDSMFNEYEALYLNEKQTRSIKNGVRMTWRGAQNGYRYRLYGNDGEFLCVSELIDGRLHIVKTFWN